MEGKGRYMRGIRKEGYRERYMEGIRKDGGRGEVHERDQVRRRYIYLVTFCLEKNVITSKSQLHI